MTIKIIEYHLFTRFSKMDAQRENLNNCVDSNSNTQSNGELEKYRHILINDVQKLDKNEIKYKIMPRLMFYSKLDSEPETQSQAIILIGEYIAKCELFGRFAVKYDVASDIISLLKSKNIELQNSVYQFLTTTLSDIINEEQEITPKYKSLEKFKESLIKSNNLVPIILRTLNRSIETESIKSALLLLELIINNKNTRYEKIACTLPALVRYLFHSNRKIATLSCQVIYKFSLIPGRAKEAIVEASILKFFIDSVSDPQLWIQQNPDEDLITPIIDTMISLLSYSNPMKQVFIDCNLLQVSKNLLLSNYRFMVSFGCTFVDYICQGSGAQINQVIDLNLFPLLLIIIKHESYYLKIKATLVINHASYHGTIDELKKLVDQDCLQTLCGCLNFVGDRLINLALMTINNFLIVERRHLFKSIDSKFELTNFAIIVNSCNIIEKIKSFLSHKKMGIRNSAASILRYSFGFEAPIGRPIHTDIVADNEDLNVEECKICFERISDTVLMPCGHRCLCNQCATQIFDSNDAIELCPVCRQRAIYGKHIELLL